jgi:polyhydroxyalkanoate synthesis regulator phasin
MSISEMAQFGAQSSHVDSADAQMEQIRELLVGDVQRRADARVEALEARVRDLEARLEALNTEQTASRRSAFEELARGVAELGERIKNLAQG